MVAFSTVRLRAVAAKQFAKDIEKPSHTPSDGAQGSAGHEAETIVPGGDFAGTYLGDTGAERPSEVVGQLRMPEIELVAPIISGLTESDLLRGVGHVPGSGNAGGLGNMAVAGHRDTYFRPLRRVAPGMLIFVSSESGSYRYKVDRTEIVMPDELKILDIGDQPQLTMITCYPFNYVGAAPKRFIVFAHLLSVESDAQRPKP